MPAGSVFPRPGKSFLRLALRRTLARRNRRSMSSCEPGPRGGVVQHETTERAAKTGSPPGPRHARARAGIGWACPCHRTVTFGCEVVTIDFGGVAYLDIQGHRPVHSCQAARDRDDLVDDLDLHRTPRSVTSPRHGQCSAAAAAMHAIPARVYSQCWLRHAPN